MALSEEQNQIWEAMSIGPQWVLRDSEPSVSLATDQTATEASKTQLSSKPEALTPEVPEKTVSTQTLKTSPEDNAAILNELSDASWEKIASLIDRCRACALGFSRNRSVPSDGAPGCPMVIVGEAPGRDEDIEGIPFVGKSGQLLTNILASMNLVRGKDVAIVNVIKCRPPNNRDPNPEEVGACHAFLDRQLSLLDPKVLVLAGRQAVLRLLNEDNSIARLRTKSLTVKINGKDVPTVVTYHPSYLLRNPVEKEKSWQDFITAKRLMVGGHEAN